LAPCRYFNKFQKRTGDQWQNIFLTPCNSVYDPTAAGNAFDKIPGKVEEKIPTAVLGTGTWRGVSDVYLDCREAKSESCGDMKVIYTEEFKIE